MPDLRKCHHVMVDLETAGIEPKSIVFSWATGIYTPEWEEKYMLLTNLSTSQQLFKNRTLNPKTIEWWMNQSKEAVEALEEDKIEPLAAIQAHCSLIRKYKKSLPEGHSLLIWGNSYSFDIYKIKSLIEDFEKDSKDLQLFDDYILRCFKSVRDVGVAYLGKEYKSSNTTHIASDDIRQQAGFMRELLS